jgi:iron complex outermembrane recepter protein
LRVDIRPKPGSADTTAGASEAADSDRQFSLHSSLDLPGHFEFDALFRYVSRITNPTQDVPPYSELDLRLAWRPTPNLEFSVVGQNLLQNRHAEFGAPGVQQGIERSAYGKITFRW